MKYFLRFYLIILIFYACDKNEKNNPETPPEEFEYVEREPITDTIFSVTANIETDPVPAAPGKDAADDPAVWIHPEDLSKSIIYGTDKTNGIGAYNLSGNQIFFQQLGNINNIDIAYNLKLANATIDVCGGTNRTSNSIDLYKIDPASGNLNFILDKQTISSVNEVYGFCFYHSPATSINYAFLCGKDGVVEQYQVKEGGEKLSLQLVRSFNIDSQPEGMVADHKHGYLYIGEEDVGIWKINAEPTSTTLQKIGYTSENNNANITYDIEGLTIYYTSSNHGHLIASIQGNSSYAIYNRSFNNSYIGSFRIKDGVIDATSGTDGIDVVNLNLGSKFPHGMFLAQDEQNMDNGTLLPQNFKLLDWKKIADTFDPPLYIDTNFNVRDLFN